MKWRRFIVILPEKKLPLVIAPAGGVAGLLLATLVQSWQACKPDCVAGKSTEMAIRRRWHIVRAAPGLASDLFGQQNPHCYAGGQLGNPTNDGFAHEAQLLQQKTRALGARLSAGRQAQRLGLPRVRRARSGNASDGGR
jgi:hypothetical protein